MYDMSTVKKRIINYVISYDYWNSMIDTNYLMDNKINNGISIQTCNIF